MREILAKETNALVIKAHQKAFQRISDIAPGISRDRLSSILNTYAEEITTVIGDYCVARLTPENGRGSKNHV